jgi:hypothetical protein
MAGETVPGLTAKVIAAAKATGAAVMIPGNVYVFGRDLPEVLTPDTPHAATIRSGASGWRWRRPIAPRA